ncbi:MAG: DUF1810 domain-containing protein [Gillisia sp.]
MSNYDLQRFLDAQEKDYALALEEIRRSRKRSHWMWYVFPQLKGLGVSTTSQFYGISGTDEAKEYLEHPVLGARLREISRALLDQGSCDAQQILGSPDNMKLRSSMTLFASVSENDPVFKKVLEKFFDGEKDQKTLSLIGQKENL